MRDARRRATGAAAAFIAGCALLSAFAGTKLSGTKTGLVLSLGTILGPPLLYVAIFAPLLFPFGLYAILTPFDNISAVGAFGTATRAVGLATGAALAFYMLRVRHFGDAPRSLVFWLILYLWMAASALWATEPQDSLAMLATAVQLLVLYFLAAIFPIDPKSLRAVLVSVLIGGVLAAGYGLYLYHNGAGVFGERLWIRTDTSAWNPDQFAASLLLPMAVALFAALSRRSIVFSMPWLLAFGAMAMALFMSGARGPSVGLVAMVGYVALRDRHKRGKIVLAGLPIAIAALVLSGPQFLARWATAAQSGGAGRADIWLVGWQAFKENWMFGAGYNNFPLAYDKAFIHVFQPQFVDWGRASHNIVLGTGVELGIIGLALLLLAWWGQFRLLNIIPEGDPLYTLRCTLEGALIGLFICGLFADIMIEKYPWLLFMIIALARNAALNRGSVAVRRA